MIQRYPSVAIATDCSDPNEAGRQSVSIQTLLGVMPVVVDVRNSIAIAGNIIDLLNVGRGGNGIVIGNCARRDGSAQRNGTNGPPFVYVLVGQTHVITTVAGYELSLVRALGLATHICALDVDLVIDTAIRNGIVEDGEETVIREGQFRSLKFVHPAACLVHNGIELPGNHMPIFAVAEEMPLAAWHADVHGNLKLTVLANEISRLRKTARRDIADLRQFPRLKDVPADGLPAIVTGSSGFGTREFLEIVINGGRAADHFGLASGDIIE